MELEEENQIKEYCDMFFYANMCHVCKRFDEGVCLKTCGGCKMITYCGKEHQNWHWSKHKPLCKAVQEVLQNYSMGDYDVCLGEWNCKKMNFMLLVSMKMKRRLASFEMDMFKFSRECLICYKQCGLVCCQKCLLNSCRSHRNNKMHKDVCAQRELCVHLDLLTVKRDINFSNLFFWRNMFNIDPVQNMHEFINKYANIEDLTISRDILVAKYSQMLSRSLTLFHSLQLLEYLQHKKVVVHLIAASYIEEITLTEWEIILHFKNHITSLEIIMIGPDLIYDIKALSVCDNCESRKKKLSFQFHNVLYDEYVKSPKFQKPDLVIGFNSSIHEQQFQSSKDTWSQSILMLAKQKCPLILTCYRQKELQKKIHRINTILNKEIDYFYSGKNPFGSLRPHRYYNEELIFFENYYMIVYKSLS